MPVRAFLYLALAGTMIVHPRQPAANPGDLDSGFGTAGIVITDFGGSDDLAFAMTAQADGKLVVAGYTHNSTYSFAIARYNADGTLDPTHGIPNKLFKIVSKATVPTTEAGCPTP